MSSATPTLVEAGRRRSMAVIALTALVASFLALVVGAPAAHATSITVNTTLDIAPDASGNFPSNDNKCSLRAAIQAAQINSNIHDDDCATGLGGGVLDVIHIGPFRFGVSPVLQLTVGRPFERITG